MAALLVEVGGASKEVCVSPFDTPLTKQGPLDIDEISADALTDQQENVLVLDIRPGYRFQGWTEGKKAGGHIAGAVSMPLHLVRKHCVDALRALVDQGVKTAKKIVIVGETTDHGKEFARMLASCGRRRDVVVLQGGMPSWSGRRCHLRRYDRLVPPQWLYSVLRRREVLVLHVNYGRRASFLQGHIPRALFLDTDSVEDEANFWNIRTAREIEALMASMGVTRSTHVIVYGHHATPDPTRQAEPGRFAGIMAAYRAAFILMWAGFNVRVLSGGLNAWIEAGYPLEKGESRQIDAVPRTGLQIPERPEILVDLPTAMSMRDAGALVSVRSDPEREGTSSGYCYMRTRGDIPGAIHGGCGPHAYSMALYRGPGETLGDFTKIVRHWKQLGLSRDRWCALYCGTGWRASESFFYAHVMGYKACVFDGGFMEYCETNKKKKENNKVWMVDARLGHPHSVECSSD